MDALAGKWPSPHAALFHNNYDGRFTEVTASAGVVDNRWGTGCVGDYDNDGWPDLYVINVGAVGSHNNHNRTFTDVAVQAGVALDEGLADVAIDHIGATLGDYDGDGNLDLFVAGYIDLDLKNAPLSGSKTAGYDFCRCRGVKVMWGPRGCREPTIIYSTATATVHLQTSARGLAWTVKRQELLNRLLTAGIAECAQSMLEVPLCCNSVLNAIAFCAVIAS